MNKKPFTLRACESLWDLWCIASVVGIWPRFIEPRWLTTKHISIPLAHLPKDLQGLRILQFSDLHLGPQTSPSYLKRLLNRIHSLRTDLCVFTGDFLCYSQVYQPEFLTRFLSSIQCPYGCYAIPGNHDYAAYTSVREDGTYGPVDMLDPPHIFKGIARLARGISAAIPCPNGQESPPPLHQELCELLGRTPFRLLNNETISVTIGQSQLNLCGLGDLWSGHFSPEKAFANYQVGTPGIILSHNPDTIPHLTSFPGDLILCGHTHGAQVNIPWLRHRILEMKHPHLYRGLFKLDDKWAYVNRGVGSTVSFRWFSRPELTLITLEASSGN